MSKLSIKISEGQLEENSKSYSTKETVLKRINLLRLSLTQYLQWLLQLFRGMLLLKMIFPAENPSPTYKSEHEWF